MTTLLFTVLLTTLCILKVKKNVIGRGHFYFIKLAEFLSDSYMDFIFWSVFVLFIGIALPFSSHMGILASLKLIRSLLDENKSYNQIKGFCKYFVL